MHVIRIVVSKAMFEMEVGLVRFASWHWPNLPKREVTGKCMFAMAAPRKSVYSLPATGSLLA